MANSELYNNTYEIPSNILGYINKTLISHPTGNGVKRAKSLLKNKIITYQSLKRLKNYFQYFKHGSDDEIEYNLAGGDLMKNFIDHTLNTERKGVEISKSIKQDIETNPNSELKPYQTPRLNESKTNKYVVALILNQNNKFLLVKRGDSMDIWQPNKWSLVGGGVEGNESPESAIKREIKEETGLEIDKFVKTFAIERNDNNVEHVFACRYDGDEFDVELDFENSGYGWFSVNEIDFLDTVPHLMEYITIAFKAYDE